MTVSLPIVSDESPCASCFTPCCSSYLVPLTGFDLWRMTRVLALPWRDVIELRSDGDRNGDLFQLDASDERWAMALKRRADKTCSFLLELPGPHHRCGVYEGRPMACRIYPYTTTHSTQLGVEMNRDALCPPEIRPVFERGLQARLPMVRAELAEREIYALVVARWNDHALRVPEGHSLRVEDFMAWVLAVYDALKPIRDRDGTRAQAEQIILAAPLPELYPPAM